MHALGAAVAALLKTVAQHKEKTTSPPLIRVGDVNASLHMIAQEAACLAARRRHRCLVRQQLRRHQRRGHLAVAAAVCLAPPPRRGGLLQTRRRAAPAGGAGQGNEPCGLPVCCSVGGASRTTTSERMLVDSTLQRDLRQPDKQRTPPRAGAGSARCIRFQNPRDPQPRRQHQSHCHIITGWPTSAVIRSTLRKLHKPLYGAILGALSGHHLRQTHNRMHAAAASKACMR